MKLRVTPDDEIGPQLRALGVSPDDVRWIVLTHLHTDHAGGLSYFPRAEIVISRREWRFATGIGGVVNGLPRRHWPSWLDPTLVDPDVPLVDGVTLLDTRGHTPGHMSVLVEDRFLIAGDASYTEQLMLDGVLDGVAPDAKAYLASLDRIRGLVVDRPTVYLPTHDPEAGARLQA